MPQFSERVLFFFPAFVKADWHMHYQQFYGSSKTHSCHFGAEIYNNNNRKCLKWTKFDNDYGPIPILLSIYIFFSFANSKIKLDVKKIISRKSIYFIFV